jgi:hypothetical protein
VMDSSESWVVVKENGVKEVHGTGREGGSGAEICIIIAERLPCMRVSLRAELSQLVPPL